MTHSSVDGIFGRPAVPRRRFTRDVLPTAVLCGVAAVACFLILRAVGVSAVIAALLTIPGTFVFYVVMVLGAILLIGYGSAAAIAVATRFRHLSFVRPLYIRLRAGAIAHARLHRIASEHTTA
jgi:hypothetical protein